MAAPPSSEGGYYYAPPPLVEIPPAPMTAPPVGPIVGAPPFQQIHGPPVSSLPVAHGGIRAAKSDLEYGLRDYMILQKRRYKTDDVAVEDRLRAQAATVVSDLHSLRNEISAVVRTAESRRWRRWIAGTAAATFIPAVRAIFRRPPEEKEAANDTEYAFRKSKTLISRITNSLPGKGALAAVAFFVFAVLYVFQNEVSLRAGRTLAKRLKRLGAKLESGRDDIDENDMKLLSGWRWRVLLWGQ